MTLSRMDEEESPLKLSDFAVSEAVEETAESFRDFARPQSRPSRTSVQQALSLRRDCFQSLGASRLHRAGSKPASHWNKKRRDRMVTPFFCVLLYAAGTALATL